MASASPKQKRAQADLATFRAVHGRAPNAGESTKGYSRRYTPAGNKRPSKPRQKDLLDTVWTWVKKNPGKTTAAVVTLGAAAVAASPDARQAVADKATKVYLAVTGP